MGEDDTVREKAIKFLEAKVKALPEENMDKDTEDYLVTECKKVNIGQGLTGKDIVLSNYLVRDSGS